MGFFGRLASRLRRSPTATTSDRPDDDDEILASLDRLQAATEGKVPPMVTARIDRGAAVVRETVPRMANLGPGSLTAHDVLRTATSYMPEAVAAYMRLPRSFADHRPVSNGKTSLAILCDQLDLLAAKMDDVFDAVCRRDADALVAHGKFLSEKFGTGSLGVASPDHL
jgi:hypothetical protein